MPAFKKRQTYLARHKRGLVIGSLIVVAAIASYGAYVGSEIWRMARHQAATESALRYRDTVYRASDNLRRPLAVDFSTGRQSIPEARIMFPATPGLDLTYGLFEPDDNDSKTVYLSSNQGVEAAKTGSSSLNGKTQGEMLASATQSVAQVQACRRQITIVLTPRGQTPVAPDGPNLKRQVELTLRDGRTATIYRDTECRSSANTLLTAAKGMTSF